MEHLIFGFPPIGYSPHIPCFNSQPAEWIEPTAWQAASEDNFHSIVRTLQPSEFDTAIVEAGDKDEQLGFCAAPMSLDEVSELHRPVKLIRRFCIQQPGGKLRVIDDAAASGQSALSSDANKLDLCSSIQPGIHVRLLQQALHRHQGELIFVLMTLRQGVRISPMPIDRCLSGQMIHGLFWWLTGIQQPMQLNAVATTDYCLVFHWLLLHSIGGPGSCRASFVDWAWCFVLCTLMTSLYRTSSLVKVQLNGFVVA